MHQIQPTPVQVLLRPVVPHQCRCCLDLLVPHQCRCCNFLLHFNTDFQSLGWSGSYFVSSLTSKVQAHRSLRKVSLHQKGLIIEEFTYQNEVILFRHDSWKSNYRLGLLCYHNGLDLQFPSSSMMLLTLQSSSCRYLLLSHLHFLKLGILMSFFVNISIHEVNL